MGFNSGFKGLIGKDLERGKSDLSLDAYRCLWFHANICGNVPVLWYLTGICGVIPVFVVP